MPSGIYMRTPERRESTRQLFAPYVGSRKGTHFSEELKQHLSEVKKKAWLDPIYRKRMSDAHKGKSLSATHAENIKKALPRGESHHNWKNEGFQYSTLHHWVRRYLGKIAECAYCGEDQKRIEWASISHKAKRDLDDYIPLCKKCHGAYDRRVRV